MARKTQSQIFQAAEKSHWQYWRLLIRNPKFWEDLYILNDKLLLFLDCAKAKSEKFSGIAAHWFYEYESLEKRAADRWGITPIPTFAVLLATKEQATVMHIRELENRFASDSKEKPIPYSPVRVIGYHPVGDFLDLRLDLTQPLYVLIRQVEKEVTKLSRPKERKRLDSLDLELAVYDLVKYEKKSFTAAARGLKKPASTVRSAYLAALRKIGITQESKSQPKMNPGPIEKCPNARCRSAEEPEDLCEAHKAFVDQDQVYLREYLAPDIASIEHARAKNQLAPFRTAARHAK